MHLLSLEGSRASLHNRRSVRAADQGIVRVRPATRGEMENVFGHFFFRDIFSTKRGFTLLSHPWRTAISQFVALPLARGLVSPCGSIACARL